MNFNLEQPQKLTKDIILSKITEEQIFSFYIGCEISSKKLFCSKLRNDRCPTCSFYRNKSGTLIYKDFATQDSLNCFGYVMELFQCDYYKALSIIANDFGLCKNNSLVKNKGKIISNSLKIEEKEFSNIQVEIQDFTDLELRWWGKYGITPEILKRFDVYSCKHVFLNGQVIAKSQQHCPIFGYYGKKYQGKELWKCYFPKRTSYRFMGNYPAKKLQGYNKLPDKGKICVITKSLKDCMALYAYNIPACAPNSETVIPSETIVNDLLERFEYVFCLWDNDYTGVTFLNKIKKKYPKLHCLIIPRSYKAKDFSDLRKLYGYKQTKQFIMDYLKWFKNHKPVN